MSAEPIPLRRDYITEMRALMDKESSSADPAPVVAERIVGTLRVTDPALLAGWLDAQAIPLLRDAILAIDRSSRARTRKIAPREQFARDATTGSMTSWLQVRYVVADGRRPILAEMTAEDLKFVCTQYDITARSARLEAAFLRALAKKVVAGTVGDHFTDEQLTALRDGLHS